MTVPNRPKEGIYYLEKEISRKASWIRRHGPELYYIYIYIYMNIGIALPLLCQPK